MSALSIELVSGIVVHASDDNLLWLLAAGPAGAVATYWAFFRYYRNTDKSHQFERDTLIQAQPVQGGEQQVGRVNRTRESSIAGDNADDYRERVRRVT